MRIIALENAHRSQKKGFIVKNIYIFTKFKYKVESWKTRRTWKKEDKVIALQLISFSEPLIWIVAYSLKDCKLK